MSSRRLNGAILQIPFIKKQGLKPLLQSVEKPLLKVKLCKKENGKFSPAFFKRRRIPKAEPLAAHRNGRNLTFRARGANKKKKAES